MTLGGFCQGQGIVAEILNGCNGSRDAMRRFMACATLKMHKPQCDGRLAARTNVSGPGLALVWLEPTPLDHSDKLSMPLAHHLSSVKITVLRTASSLLATTRGSAPAPVGVDVDLGGYAIAAIGGPTRA